MPAMATLPALREAWFPSPGSSLPAPGVLAAAQAGNQSSLSRSTSDGNPDRVPPAHARLGRTSHTHMGPVPAGAGRWQCREPPSAQGFTLTLRMELRTQGCRDWAELGYSSYPLDKVERLWLNTRKQKWYLCLILKKISLRCLLLESDVVNCTHLMTSQHSCRGNLGNWGKGL